MGGDVAAPSDAASAEDVPAVEIMDVDAISDDEAMRTLTVAITRAGALEDGKRRWRQE